MQPSRPQKDNSQRPQPAASAAPKRMKRVFEQMPTGLDGCILQAMAPDGANTEESGVVYVYIYNICLCTSADGKA